MLQYKVLEKKMKGGFMTPSNKIANLVKTKEEQLKHLKELGTCEDVVLFYDYLYHINDGEHKEALDEIQEYYRSKDYVVYHDPEQEAVCIQL